MRLQGLFELLPIGVALNDFKTGKFIEVNNALVEPTGYTTEEFLKLSYWDVTPNEYAAREEEQLRMLDLTGRFGPYEKAYLRKNGDRYPVLLSGMVMRDASGRKMIWSIIEDISERKQAEKTLRESQEKY